ncbi:hypothetical protein BDF19DRAFT_438986 [Syncephalis fuscata]|nr:hypothetical protein BDF19DRAFT_438986 [Syncephalis fuscata]
MTCLSISVPIMRVIAILLIFTSSLVVASEQTVLPRPSGQSRPLWDTTINKFDTVLNSIKQKVITQVHEASWKGLRTSLIDHIGKDLKEDIPKELEQQYSDVAKRLRDSSDQNRLSIAQATVNAALNLATDAPIFINQKMVKYFATAPIDIVTLTVQSICKKEPSFKIQATITKKLEQHNILPSNKFSLIALQLCSDANALDNFHQTFNGIKAYTGNVMSVVFDVPSSAPNAVLHSQDIQAQLAHAIESAVKSG